jgi:heme exporter protein B
VNESGTRLRRPRGRLRHPPASLTLLRKDLLLERRAPEAVPAMLLFSVTTFVLFHFGLQRDALDGSLAAGVLLVTLLFAAVLGINRLFVSEQEEGGFDGVLLAPIDRTALFLAKAGALFLFLALVEVVAVAAFAILLLGPSPWPALPGLLAVLALLDLALAVVGTLVAALAIRTRARDLIVPIVALPLLVPALIAAARAVAPLLAAGGAEALPAKWLAVLALYDLVFGLIAYAVFDFLMED